MQKDKPRAIPPIPQRHESKLTSVSGVLSAVELYFETCDERKMSYTIPGLCYFLGLGDTKLLFGSGSDHARQEKSVESKETVRLFSSPAVKDALMLARMRIQAQRASQLLDDNDNKAGVIFDLKSTFDWQDKQNLSVTNPDGHMGSKVAVVLPAAPGSVNMEQWQEMYKQVMGQREGIESLGPAETVEE